MNFWRSCPALLYGVAVLLSFAAAYHFTPTLLLPLALLLFTAKSRLLPLSLVLGAAYFFAAHYYQAPPLPANGAFGKAEFRVEQISSNQTKFQDLWMYKGTLLSFSGVPYRSKCYIKLPAKEERPSANYIYSIDGTLKETLRGRYTLTVKKGTPWTPLEKTKNFAEWRYQAKNYLKSYIHAQIPNEKSAQFLAGIATGQFNDPYFSFEFGRFGLQHIMAISGFHFATIAFILNMLLCPFFSYRKAAAFVMLLLTAYFFLLGFSPSVLRAWLMILIGLSSQLLERPTNSLNSFGIALLATLLVDPLMIANLGFQFSFAITAGILLLYSPLNSFAKILLGSHTPAKLNMTDQHGYLVLCFLRQGAALTLTVHIVAIPIVLLFFEKFPLFSMVYNLFFPFLVTFSMLFLILGFLTAPLPFIPDLFHQMNDLFTEYLINLTYYLPLTLDYTIRTTHVSSDFVILYLTIIFFFGLWLLQRKQYNQNFMFV